VTGLSPAVLFRETGIVLAEGGAFSLDLLDVKRPGNLALVIDIYGLDHEVHPEGHVGWWKFALPEVAEDMAGRLRADGRGLSPAVDAIEMDRWVNPSPVEASAWVAIAVLRDRTTNAIVALHRVPVFRDQSTLAAFRAASSGLTEGPQLARADGAWPEGATVRIVAPSIRTHDAVGNLCFDLRRLLVRNGIPAAVYAQHYDLAENEVVRPVASLSREVGRHDTLLYSFSIDDPMLPAIAEMRWAMKIAYFHGITRPEAVRRFDPELAAACARAMKQAALLEGFDRLAANSRASAQALVASFGATTRWTANDIVTVAPRLMGSGAVAKARATAPAACRLLCVGRIAPHKKIEDALALLAEIRKSESSTELVIVGGGADKAYRDFLFRVQRDLRLPEGSVHWLGVIGADDLDAEYDRASAYVSMSEDEGFGLPLLEAMMRGVPVVACALPAVLEVAGGSGLLFHAKDPPRNAAQVLAFLKSDAAWRKMSSRSLARARELLPTLNGGAFLTLLRQ
jgi:glycosyltransferase involved in cell wall biosynthesis